MPVRAKILYSLPGWNEIEEFVRAGLFEAIAESADFDWTFVCPQRHVAELRTRFVCDNVRVEPFPAEGSPWIDRELIGIRQILWRSRLPEPMARAFARTSWRQNPLRYLRRAALTLASGSHAGLENMLEGRLASLPPDRCWLEAISRLQPAAVILGGGGLRQREQRLLRAARQQKIPALGIVSDWETFATAEPPVIRADRLAVWSSGMRRSAIERLGYAPDQVLITGPLGMAPMAKRPSREERGLFLRDQGLDPLRRLIVFSGANPAMSPWNHEYARQIAQAIGAMRFAQPCQLVVRLHAKDFACLFDGLGWLPNVRFEPTAVKALEESEEEGALEGVTADRLIAYGDVVVSTSATTMLTACALDRPVILPAFSPYRPSPNFEMATRYCLPQYQPIVESGAAWLASTPEDMTAAIEETLADPFARSLRRRSLYRDFDPFGDGRSSLRLADEIIEFVGTSPSGNRARSRVAA